MTREELEQKLDWALGEIEAVKPAFDLAIKTAQRAELEITRLQEALAAAEARIAETRKKALEEAAAHLMQVSDAMWERCEIQRPTEPWARPPAAEKEDAVTAWCFQKAADAIRSLPADEAQP